MNLFLRILFVSVIISNLIFLPGCKKRGQEGEAKAARVTFISGDVTVQSSGAAVHSISLGDYLHTGDTVRTPAGATLELFIKGQGIVRISESAEVFLEQLLENEATSIKINKGSSAFFLRKQDRKGNLSAATPTAVASVRGTTFMLENMGDETRVSLFDGSLSLSNDTTKDFAMDRSGEILIRKGQTLTQDMIRPHSKESLELIKRLAIFQKNNILEYNSLVEELKTSEVIQGLEVNESVSDQYARLNDEETESTAPEKTRKAEENTIRRDTKDEQLKLPANRQYNNNSR